MRICWVAMGLGLAGAGCGGDQVLHGYLQYSALSTGTGTVNGSTLAMPASNFYWSSDYSSVTDFVFVFGDGDASASLTCDSVPIENGAAIPVAQTSCSLCLEGFGVGEANNGACAPLASGTLQWSSDLDRNGNGTAAVELDDDEVLSAFHGTGTSPPTLSVTIQMQTLTGMASFADEYETQGFGPGA